MASVPELPGSSPPPLESEVVRSRDVLYAIVESAPIAMIMVDRGGRIILANAETESLFGYQRGELLGAAVEVLVPQRLRGLHPAFRVGYGVTPEARTMGAGRDLFALRKDGSEFPVEIGLNPITTPDGVFVLSAIVNISNRKRLEARVRLVVESAPLAMVMINRRGQIELVNAQAEQLFGYPRAELKGKPIEVLVPDRFRGHHPNVREEYFDRPTSRRMGAGRDLFAVRKDGVEVPVEIGLNPIDTEDGQFVLSAIVDITERKKLEEAQVALNAELSRSNEALERSNVELRQFAYIASHDLQTPLRGIAGCSQILQRKFGSQLGQDGAELIKRIVEGTTRLQSLIDDLLTCSRVESRARPFEPVDMRAVVDDALRLLESSVQDTRASVMVGALPWVLGDRAQLVQLMQNLVGNAIKYHGKAPPQIRINSACNANECTISVADNGIGIEPRHRENVFEIFRRLHTQEAYPGNGIGLAICRRVVNRHGGQIWVEGNEGGGSVFLFTARASAEGAT